MQGLLSSRRGAALYLLVWLMLGVLWSGVIVSTTDTGWVNALILAVPVTVVYAIATGFSAYYLCRANPLAERSPAAIALVFTVAGVVSGILWTILTYLWNGIMFQTGVSWTGVPLPKGIAWLVLGLGVLLYGLSVVVHYLVIEFERARQAERREFESKVMAQEAELRMLRTQIDPHFLFNSLNSISALTAAKPQAAREMTLRLADFFRQSLGMEAHRKVTLDQEMVLIGHFLAIETVRFGARLAIETEIGAGAGACLVPPMIVQPLVENAVKHGIGNLPEGGTVRIRAERAGSLLRVSVENDIDTDMPAARKGGIGLANVRQRLGAAYAHEAGVNWARRERTFWVEIAMPAETREA